MVDSVVVSLVDSEELLELLVASEELLEEEELLLELEELLEELEELLEAVVLSVSLLSQPTKARTVKSIATTIMRAKNFFMIKVLLL